MKKAIFTMVILMAAIFCTAQSGSKAKISANRTDNSGPADVTPSLNGKKKISPLSGRSACGTYTVTDADGNIYNTVKIGDQCWMAENLRVGIMIPGTTNQVNNGIIEKHCYGDLPSNCNTYGGLYQWGELMQYSGQPKTQGICPAGWNIPASGDYQWLGYLVGDSAGGKLKTTGTIEGGNGLWYAPNTMATNKSGFSALPGGWKDEAGNFGNLGLNAFFFTSEGWYECCAYFRQLAYNDGYLNNASWAMRSRSMSVRCIKNAAILPTVSTSSVSKIASTTAVGGGNVTDDGGAEVTARGVVWSTTQNPTVGNHEGITMDGTGAGVFTSNLTGLAPGTHYYVKAYATNSAGTAYGAEVGFTSIPAILALTDLIINPGTEACYDASQTITVSDFTVKTGGSANLIAGVNIVLQPESKVENGGYLRASITTDENYCVQKKTMLTIPEKEAAKEIITNEPTETSALFTLFPNPAATVFTLKMLDYKTTQAIRVEIYGMMGERIIQTGLAGQKQYEFDITGWSKGVYLIRVTAGDKNGLEKLIKQ
ncbi:MAG: FISUMP domain-containing protein [Bacteroidota bacterium]